MKTRMYIRRWVVATALVVVALGTWLISGRTPTTFLSSADEGVLRIDHVDVDRANLVATDVAQHMVGGQRPVGETTSAAQLYGDTRLSLRERFDLLEDMGRRGDAAAKHLALAIATMCWGNLMIPVDRPPIGASVTTDYLTQLGKSIHARCQDVSDSPGYAQMLDVIKARESDAITRASIAAVRQQFMDNGSEAALAAAVAAVRVAPDESMAAAMGHEVGQLGIPALFQESLFQSPGSLSSHEQQKYLDVALQLLACDFGRPCGPDSMDVQMRCFGFGTCVPGADLRTLYEREYLNGQEMRDIAALLDYLRRLQGPDHP